MRKCKLSFCEEKEKKHTKKQVEDNTIMTDDSDTSGGGARSFARKLINNIFTERNELVAEKSLK